ncbi:MAG: ABC transporter ATP-binding protein/permease [Eubacteriales bacterium]|nr:ABC transporter ATP-binding protein/permease [Eubacteriales bacterium]
MESSEKKQEKKPVNWRVVGLMMKGNIWGLVLAGIFLVLAIAASYCGPLLVSFTVDYVIGTEGSSLPAFIMNWAEGIGGREFFRNNLYVCALALIAFTAVNGLSTFGRRYFTAIASEGIAKTLRDKLYWHLQSVPYDYYKHVSTGDLVQRCTSDVETIRRFISQQLLEILRTLVMVAFAGAIMFSLDVRMATISVVLMPFLCAASFIYFRYVRKYFTASDEAEGKMSATIQENLTGVRVVRAFGQQFSEVEKFTEINTDFREKTYKLIMLLGVYWGSTDAFGYLQIGLSLFASIYFCVTEGMTLGTLLIFSTYTAMLTWPVRQLGRVLADLGKATVSLDRIGEIFAHEVEKEPGAALEPEIRGSIEFKNVCFGYDTYDEVLKDISFTAGPGQTVAILGSTGSGKTSLVQLLQRLYTCTRGEILVNGVNINDIERGHLRRNIGIVLQEPFLYSRTILENIRIADPNSSEDAVYESARVAAVHDVIQKFDNGYETLVGERGVTLSGGQKQRVAIARMLMQKAPIIIFDDSMSAVDTETDAAIRTALRHRRESTTTFIISHRITTLCEADNILVLEHGRLVQQGTHEQLLKEEGLYRRIAEIQNMLEDELRQEGGEAR